MATIGLADISNFSAKLDGFSDEPIDFMQVRPFGV